ncbi:MAG TPA: T9SS type A sorting domain-containing protein [Candidatus Marinimicrobia bacterium]|nr:T9SS type A sorting domain-containing protein [Candidatus Neomarinimicrobiota bacterium]
MKKSILINLVFCLSSQFVYGQCDEGFIYINEIPSSVTMWPADSCFYLEDLTALEDILSINELSSYTSPLEMGTQTWINGRFKNWVADYNFSGSGLAEPISILPESIGNWTQLSYLALQWNNLSSVPESLGLLTGLSSLYISNNQLISLPEAIGNLSNLYFVDLGYNQIEAIPESFCDLDNLSYLWLFNNLLFSMPECICDLNIDWSGTDAAWYPYFAIGGNYLCEDLPECIANSEHLDISLDQFIYSFMVEDVQNCGGDSLMVNVQTDWNLVGLPLEVEDPSYAAVFPSAIPGTLFLFDGTYIQTQDLINGNGYWLRFDEPATVAITGAAIQELSINLLMDWNLISGISDFVDISQVNDPDGIIIPGTFYGFEDTYTQVSQLEPGKGYWVRTNNSGEIILSTNSQFATRLSDIEPKNTNTLKFGKQTLYFGENVLEENVLSYSLPPKPPSGALDIRFFSDTKLCIWDECVIEVMGSGQPVTLECDIKKGEIWEIVDEYGNVFMCSENQIVNLSGTSQTLVLRKSTNSISPTSFSMGPAYPNPFNPLTTISYTLQKPSYVVFSVLNINGEEIDRLVDSTQDTGPRSIIWDSKDHPSGVYLFKLVVGEKTIFSKGLLLK